jgi:hypothetical protein
MKKTETKTLALAMADVTTSTRRLSAMFGCRRVLFVEQNHKYAELQKQLESTK